MRSLKVRLVLFLIVPFVVLLPFGAVLQYYIALVPMRSALDRGLERVALAVSLTVHSDNGRISATLPLEGLGARREAALVALVDAEGRLIAGDPRLVLAMPKAKLGETLLADIIGDEDLHVAAHGVSCGTAVCQVRVAELRKSREYLERDVLLGSVAGTVLLLLLIGVVMWFGARDGLAPVRELRRQMESRSLDDLTPVALNDPPDELVSIVDAINEMFVRVRQAAEANQAFVAAAAHQLRTPLARLTTQLELALQQRRDDASDQATLAGLKSAVDRMSRLTQQLLTLARSDATARPALAFSEVDLKEIVLSTGAAWVPRAAELGIDLGFDAQSAPVLGNAQLLGEALANLIDNALRHGARHITARTCMQAMQCELDVEDDGSGIAPQDRERVFQRFARGSSSRGEGSGLGLPIVRQIVQLHDGQVDLLEGRRGGLRVLIRLPVRQVERGAST